MSDILLYVRTAYKSLAILLVGFAIVAGLIIDIPPEHTENLLQQTWRNLFYHVPMWYALMIMFIVSGVSSIRFLSNSNLKDDIRASNYAVTGVLFGALGLLTGTVWSRVTWGAALPATDPSAWWAWDPKQSSALLLVLLYGAYFLLRVSFNDPVQKAKVAAVYNIFGMAMLVPLLYILPKFLGGLHPGSGEEGMMAALKNLNGMTRLIFYPASLGFILTGVWISELMNRTDVARMRLREMSEQKYIPQTKVSIEEHLVQNED